MAGKVVKVDNLDSVQIEVLWGRAVTIPASVLLDVDAVLRHCRVEEEALDVDMVGDDETGWHGWEAAAGNDCAHGDTPWGAIVALARALEARGR
jgi:hypothetical protein